MRPRRLTVMHDPRARTLGQTPEAPVDLVAAYLLNAENGHRLLKSANRAAYLCRFRKARRNRAQQGHNKVRSKIWL